MRKRLLSALLTVCMLLTMLPVTAFAADTSPDEHYVTVNYDNDGLYDRKITVNVYDENGNQVDTVSINDAKLAEQKITVKITDTHSQQYDIENVYKASGSGNFYSANISENSCDFRVSDIRDDEGLIVSVQLCPNYENPEVVNEHEDWWMLTLEYRLYEPQMLEMLYLNGDESVNKNTTVSNVDVHFVQSYAGSENYNLNGILTGANNLPYRTMTLSDAGDKGNPENIRYLEITYNNNDGTSDKTVRIYSGDLRYTGTMVDSRPVYEIEHKNNDEHVVAFYTEPGAQSTTWHLYDLKFVPNNQPLGLENMPEEPTFPATDYIFTNWAEAHDGGEPFLPYENVIEDKTVYAQKTSSEWGGTRYQVMNPDNAMMDRFLEIYNAQAETEYTSDQIDMSSVKIQVNGTDKYGTKGNTNPNYWNNGWLYEGEDQYYRVVNSHIVGNHDTVSNTHIPHDKAESITIFAKVNGEKAEVTIPIDNSVPGGVHIGLSSVDNIAQIFVNDPPEPPEEGDIITPPDGLLSEGAVKVDCVSENEHADQITGLLKGSFTPPTQEDIEWAVGEGDFGYYYIDLVVDSEKYIAEYNNTYPDHKLAEGEAETQTIRLICDEIANGEAVWEVQTQIPITFEVVCQQTPGPGTDPEPGELNGTAVTVQVYVDGEAVKNPLTYIDLSRNSGNSGYTGWEESSPDENGIITCDFNYEADAANGGYDCVDIQVNVKGATYVLQGVHSYQSYGSEGTKNVTANSDGTYTIDNVTAVDNATDPDVKIYLRTKYTVGYYENSTKSQTVTDDGAYIADEDVKSTTPETGEPSKENGSAWMDWKNDTLKTSITVKGLPTVAGTVTGWWLNDNSYTGDPSYGPDKTYETVNVSTAIIVGLAGSEIKFYAKVEGKEDVVTEYWVMNTQDEVELFLKNNWPELQLSGMHISTGTDPDVTTPRASDDGWSNDQDHFVIHNGTPGSEHYVPYTEARNLTFDDASTPALGGLTNLDIRVEAPVEGVSKVYILFDFEFNANNWYWMDMDEDGIADDDEFYVDRQRKTSDGQNWIAGSQFVFSDNGISTPVYKATNDREVIFLGWTTKQYTTIYEPDAQPPQTVTEIVIDPHAEYVNYSPTPHVILYALWGYASPLFDVDKALTKVVRNGGEVQDDLAGLTLYPGDQLTWTITVTNGSNAQVTGLKLADTLKASDTIITEGVQVTAPDGVDPNNFTVGANDNVVFTVTYTVKETDVNTTLTNSAEVTSPDGEGPGDEDQTENPVANPKLTVTKKADKTTASAGDEITYTVNVTNNGDAPLTDVTVKDDMWARENNYPIKIDGSDDYAANGEFTLKTPIAPKATVTITYTYTVTEADVTAGNIVNRVTVDGGEEGGPGGDEETVWTGKVTITPADIVIYTGGAGYGGVTDGNGEIIEGTETSGLPQPGFHIELSEDIESLLHGSAGSMDDQKAANLSEILTFTYDYGGQTREWTMEYVGIYANDAKTGEPTRYVYSLNPATVGSESIPVRILYFEDANVNGKYDEGETVRENDEFLMDENIVYNTYAMTINPGELDQGQIKAKLNVNGQVIECNVAIGTGDLTVKSVDDPEYTKIAADQNAVSGDNIVAVPNGTVNYYVNDSEVKVENTDNRVQLLVDDVSNNDVFNNALGEAATKKVTGLDNVKFATQYLDLVDTANGNAVVTLGDNQKLSLYWPVPSDAADDSAFHIVHYTDMDRESPTGTDDLASKNPAIIEGTRVTIGGKDYIEFETSSFSPFVLVYEGEGSGSTSSGTTRYTLTYESNGGTEYNSERYRRNTVVELDKTPIREGYTFTGWYADKDLEERITEIKMTSNKTVYAGWEPTDVPNWLNGDDHFSYIIGREDGLIHPDSNITRAEVATIFFRLLQEDVRDQYLTESNSFTDVSADAWYNTAISTMASMGIVEGDLSGTFRPDDNITRAEFAAIAARFSNGSYDGADIFNDIADHWAREEINLVASTGWLNGYTSGSFNPNREITRAESMTIVNRMLKRLPENTSDLLEGMIEWPDNQSESAWYYLAVQEATNSHDFERKDDGVHESWTELTENTDWEQYQ